MKLTARILLAAFFVLAGINHFRMPEIYLGMMPPGLPFPEAANVISGIAEILGGIGVLIPRVRRFAGWGLIALLIAIFPANLHAAFAGQMAGLPIPAWVLWVRLPVQLLFIAWVWWVALARERRRS